MMSSQQSAISSQQEKVITDRWLLIARTCH